MVATRARQRPPGGGRIRRRAAHQQSVGLRLIIWLSFLFGAMFIVRQVANSLGVTTQSMFPTDDISHYVPTDLFLHLQQGVTEFFPIASGSGGGSGGGGGSSSSNNVANRATRIYKYTQIYKYTPPIPRPSANPPIECGSPPEFDTFFEQSAKATREQDKRIYDYLFRDKIKREHPGTYVEVGAFDGRKGSNSRFFDECLGWPGLLIDANPNVYPTLLSQRPYTHRMNFAASCTAEQEARSPTVTFTNTQDATAGVEGRALAQERDATPVPCGPLGDVLTDMFDDTRITFLAVSVENSEVDVIQTIDFDKVKIDVILVEADPKFCLSTCENREKVRSTLTFNAGFQLHDELVEGSDLFIHKDSPYHMTQGVTLEAVVKTDSIGGRSAMENDNKSPAVQVAAPATTAVVSTSSSEGPLSVISRDAERLAKYTNVYNYQAPTEVFFTPAEHCSAGPDFQGFISLAAHTEDKMLYDRYFRSVLNGKKGTYVEIGAFDGIKESISRFYDQCLGWKGLLIEANTISYGKLVRNRPMAHKLQFSPSCSAEYEKENGKVPFYQYPYTTTGLVGVAQLYEGKPLTENVPCGPLGPLLEDAFGEHHIDLVILDVEGAEHLILGTIDFKRIKIDLILVEVFSMFCKENCESRDITREIMANAGYVRFENSVPQSDVYLHPDLAAGYASVAGATPASNIMASGGSNNAPPQTTTPAVSNKVAPPKTELTPEQALGDKSSRFAKYTTSYKYFPPAGAISQAAKECGTGPDFQSFFQLTSETRSTNDEDKIVYEKFFKDQLTGAGNYVEIGAFDGNQDSNSRFFDVCLSWKGLLVEGNPAAYQKTLQHRPQSHGMNFAPSCEEDAKVHFYKIDVASSGIDGITQGFDGQETVEVPCGPLGPVLLDIFGSERINFFSLDVEGAEAYVLNTIDFATIKIDVLLVDTDKKYTSSVYETRAIMNQAGYILRRDVVPHSDVYVHPNLHIN